LEPAPDPGVGYLADKCYICVIREEEMWVRPEKMFFGTVERDGKVMPRFSKITEDEALGKS
jgi:hypothetical protein